MFAKWPVNAKKLFRLKFWKILLFQIAWKTTSCERKNIYFVYEYMGIFAKYSCFHWA